MFYNFVHFIPTDKVDVAWNNKESTCLHHQPTDGANMTWGLIRTSHRETPDYREDGYNYSYTGSGADLYIIDSGIDILHIDFSGRASHGFVSTELESEGVTDWNGHGTNVASLAGGSVYGIAKEANVILGEGSG